MGKETSSARLEESLDRYRNQRAQDKYEGNGPPELDTAAFRKFVDYLRSIGNKVTFTGEDLEDIVRMAELPDLPTLPAQDAKSRAESA